MGEDRAKRRRPQPADARRDESLSRDQRITRTVEFRSVMSVGVRGVSQYLVAIRRKGGGGGLPRLGVVASRKIGGAVQRSRAKRLLREVYRRGADRPAGDLILIARRGIGEASWPDLERAYRTATRRATRGGQEPRRAGRQDPGGKGRRA